MDQGRNRIVIRKTKPAFSHEQKLGLALVIGVGGLAILMGMFYVGGHMSSAFDYHYDGPPLLTPEQQQAQALKDLQNSDTDSDSLTDYEELYLYRTSPYLADTDGDGIDDSTELTQGTDPSCSSGQDCESGSGQYEVIPPSEASELVIPGQEMNEENQELLDSLLSGVAAEEVRAFLLESGVDPESVENLTDEEVLEIYRTTIIELDESGELEGILQEQQSAQ